MKYLTTIAIVSIASFAMSTRAGAEDIYRCGNSYSQKPCPDGTRVDVQDARTAAQKAESDASIRRESSTANAMEKARLQEEARLQAANAKAAAKDKKKASKPVATSGTDAAKAHKDHAKKKKEPEYFTASGPSAEKPKPAASKAK